MTDDKKHKTDADKSQYRRDKIKEATPATLTKEERALMTKMYQVARQMSASTGTKYQVDHIVPLAIGGLHTPENLQIITEEQNKKRGSTSRLPEEGAILCHMIKDEIRASGGKFVKGVSGNPNGRPKKVNLQDEKTQKLLFDLYLESQGDKEEFKRLVLANGKSLKIGLEDLLGIIKKFEDISLTKQKVDKNTEEKIEKLEIVLTSIAEYDKIIKNIKGE